MGKSEEKEVSEDTEVLGKKPTPVPIYPSQIPHGLPGIEPGPQRSEATD